ncbi:peptidoglycan-binding domain-containing protein [Nocardiopsis coralliicola]
MPAVSSIRAAATAVLASAALFAGGAVAGAPAALADGPNTPPEVRQQIQQCDWVELKPGSEGWRVKVLEHLLVEWGHFGGTPDELYNEKGTAVAVTYYQESKQDAENPPPVDGVVGNETWEHIRSDFGIVGDGTEEEPSHMVRAVQTALLAHGYDIKRAEETDGRWGPVTEQSVREFQAEAGIDVDGDVGPDTFKALLAADVCIP